MATATATTTTTSTIPSTGANAAANAKTAAEAAVPHSIPSEKTKAPKISHGRGGAANIGVDDTIYADGGIVREGYAGDQGDGAYSTGRGGTANIGSPGIKASKAADSEIIPETALRSDDHQVFHTGRGGEGNLHHQTSVSDAPKPKPKKEKNEGETSSQSPSVNGSGSDSNEEKSKKRRSLFGRSHHTKVDAVTDPVKAAKKADYEEKHPPPTHSGLGDKLKYKIFGKLYD